MKRRLSVKKNIKIQMNFQNTAEFDLRPLQAVIRSTLRQDYDMVFSASSTLFARKFPEFGEFLLNSGWSKDESSSLYMPPSNIKQFLNVQSFFEQNINPFCTKLSHFLNITKEKKNYESIKDVLDKLLEDIISDSSLPENVKEQLNLYKDSVTYTEKIEKSVKDLEKVMSSSIHNKFQNFGHIDNLLKLLIKKETDLDNSNIKKFLSEEFLPSLINSEPIIQQKYCNLLPQLQMAAKVDLYDVLRILSSISMVDPKLYAMKYSLDRLTRLNDVKGLEKFFKDMADAELNEEQLNNVFNNPRVQLLLERTLASNDICRIIQHNFCTPTIPSYIPLFMANEIQKIVNDDTSDECPETFATINDVLVCFQKIMISGKVPRNFAHVSHLFMNAEL